MLRGIRDARRDKVTQTFSNQRCWECIPERQGICAGSDFNAVLIIVKEAPVLHGQEGEVGEGHNVQLGQEIGVVEEDLILGQNGACGVEGPVEVVDAVWRGPHADRAVRLARV